MQRDCGIFTFEREKSCMVSRILNYVIQFELLSSPLLANCAATAFHIYDE